jgi:hypothetical protein
MCDGSRPRRRCQDTLVLWLQDAQINRTQLVARIGGAYLAAAPGSTDSIAAGSTSTSRPNGKVPTKQSRLTTCDPLEWTGGVFSVRGVWQHDELVQQPFWQPASLTLE